MFFLLWQSLCVCMSMFDRQYLCFSFSNTQCVYVCMSVFDRQYLCVFPSLTVSVCVYVSVWQSVFACRWYAKETDLRKYLAYILLVLTPGTSCRALLLRWGLFFLCVQKRVWHAKRTAVAVYNRQKDLKILKMSFDKLISAVGVNLVCAGTLCLFSVLLLLLSHHLCHLQRYRSHTTHPIPPSLPPAISKTRST